MSKRGRKVQKINTRGCGKLEVINPEIHRVLKNYFFHTGFQQVVENGVGKRKEQERKMEKLLLKKRSKLGFCARKTLVPSILLNPNFGWGGGEKELRSFRFHCIFSSAEGVQEGSGATLL